jgi:hypothetical protein
MVWGGGGGGCKFERSGHSFLSQPKFESFVREGRPKNMHLPISRGARDRARLELKDRIKEEVYQRRNRGAALNDSYS